MADSVNRRGFFGRLGAFLAGCVGYKFPADVVGFRMLHVDCEPTTGEHWDQLFKQIEEEKAARRDVFVKKVLDPMFVKWAKENGLPVPKHSWTWTDAEEAARNGK